MNQQAIVQWAFQAASALMQLRDSSEVAEVKEKAQTLLAQFTKELPPAPNGIAWTREDLELYIQRHDQIMAELTARHGRS